MKKCFTLIITFSFIIMQCIDVYATKEIGKEENIASECNNYAITEFAFNEYEELLKSINQSQYRNSNNNSISYLDLLEEKYNYINHLYELKELSYEQLIEKNYTETQIYNIKNFDGSDRMAIQAAASVYANVSVTNYNYVSANNYTDITIAFAGHWNGEPVLGLTDQIGIGLVGSNASFSRISSNATITYKNYRTLNCTTYKYESMKGVVYRFGARDDNGFFQSFSMNYTGRAQGHVTVFEYGAAYAHQSVSINLQPISLGLCIDGGPSVGISFSVSTSYTTMWNHTFNSTHY